MKPVDHNSTNIAGAIGSQDGEVLALWAVNSVAPSKKILLFEETRQRPPIAGPGNVINDLERVERCLSAVLR